MRDPLPVWRTKAHGRTAEEAIGNAKDEWDSFAEFRVWPPTEQFIWTAEMEADGLWCVSAWQ